MKEVKFMDKNTRSLGFSHFRELMDLWDHNQILLEAEDKINDLFDKHGLILFFKRGKDLYGAPEDSRMVFARLKNPHEDDDFIIKDEAKFLAINLLKSMYGDPEESVENMFGFEDLPKIKVCDRDDIIQQLIKHNLKK